MNIIAIIIFIIIALQALPASGRGRRRGHGRRRAYGKRRASGRAYRPVAGIYNTCGKGRRR